ncbi:MAG: c-type cytochrome, partial [Nitrospinae bacterium]|nr:c-type cytochrome [Nitrospinota bacterium]
MKRNFFSLCAGLTILGLLFLIPSHLFAASEALDGKIKKIVMMMNIVAKEFAIGIAPEGDKMVVPAEFEESKVFLAQAFERYTSLSPTLGDASVTDALTQKFDDLTVAVNARVAPAKVRAAVSDINSQLLEISGTKMNLSPATPVSLGNGKQIYLSNCQVCHGAEGKGDGPLANQLDPAPAVLADPEITGDESTTAYDNFQVINVGIANTPMPAWADLLTEPEMWDVTYYIRSFSNVNVKLPLISAGLISPGDTGEAAKLAGKIIDEVRGLIDQSLQTFKGNHRAEAAEQAFDAYLAYENIESGLISKRKELGLRLESGFSRYRAEIKRGADLGLVEKLHAGLHSDLDKAFETLTQDVGFTGLFIQSLSIIVREGFEAILIIAALVTFLIKSRNRDKLKAIYTGVGLGV